MTGYIEYMINELHQRQVTIQKRKDAYEYALRRMANRLQQGALSKEEAEQYREILLSVLDGNPLLV